jgi:LysM repeat protein
MPGIDIVKNMKSFIIIPIIFFAFSTLYGQNHSAYVDSIKIKELLNFSAGKLGCVYDWGASGPSRFDCSGFTQYVFQHIGITLPRVSTDQYFTGKVITISDIRKGDLVFFISREKEIDIGHVGLAFSDYSNGDFQFIHACSSMGEVCFSNYKNKLYSDSYVGARRIINFNDDLKNTVVSDTPNKFGAISKQNDAITMKEEETKKRFQQFPNDYFYYQVRSGETLFDISRKYFVSVENLMKWNNLLSNILNDTRQIKIYLSPKGF